MFRGNWKIDYLKIFVGINFHSYIIILQGFFLTCTVKKSVFIFFIMNQLQTLSCHCLNFSRNNIIPCFTRGMANMMQSNWNITPLYAYKKHYS